MDAIVKAGVGRTHSRISLPAPTSRAIQDLGCQGYRVFGSGELMFIIRYWGVVDVASCPVVVVGSGFDPLGN